MRIETVATTSAGGRAVVELLAHLDDESDEQAWPVAVVAESPDDLSVVFRTYCSQWPVAGVREIRPAILEPGPVHPGGVVGRYQEALDAGDVEAVVSTFAPDGYFREPIGPHATHRGESDLRTLFKTWFSAGGGIGLEQCAVTDDGVRCALEYNCVRWGTHALQPQAGIGVYERAPDGRLAAVRVYDDVEAPLSPVASQAPNAPSTRSHQASDDAPASPDRLRHGRWRICAIRPTDGTDRREGVVSKLEGAAVRTRKIRVGVMLGVTVAIAVACGAAFAYWTSGGTGTGSGHTGTSANVTVKQTSSAAGLYPGSSVALSGNFDNASSSQVYITAVTASVTPFSARADANKPACTQADFSITGTATVGAEIAPGTGVGSWSGLSLTMADTATNQDNCQNITVPITYTAS